MVETRTREEGARTLKVTPEFERQLTFCQRTRDEFSKEIIRWAFTLRLVDSVKQTAEYGRLVLTGVLIDDRGIVFEGGVLHCGSGRYMLNLCRESFTLYKPEDLERALIETHSRILDYANRINTMPSKFGCPSLQTLHFPLVDKTPYAK